ncbi:Emp24/gp25L/p24 membrane trafficking protein [Basidiobolus meristosporus CBS 931.73]|uniref:Emp24/gp25L/p24 membrane trafficking protein n=1 Tax=Basidiobolus meristosporus CBS 931.73 TaxID=1314790 RepID=A0A1Y1YLM4_9FUNG|nr:Emp24/gp25L/p24 membrane trafficking protein [Basidiobolus meristosporus CBS 931.73]|eukprot:ORX98909.1 Emp24/gp25L/p24 membrane trafficking protein [Basidiobolus meristosporus CBS 931.73]
MLKICALLLLSFTVVLGHRINVEPRTSECFYEEVKKGDSFVVNYEVSDYSGGIDFRVTDNTGRTIHWKSGLLDDFFTVVAATDDVYTYCFINEDGKNEVRAILWNVHENSRTIQSDDESTEHAEITPIEDEIVKLRDGIYIVKFEHEYIVNRERTHRNTCESTNARVKWWSFFQTGLLIAACAFQVIYLKRFFEAKRKTRI